MNCISNGKYTGDSCFGCPIKVEDCEIRDKVYKNRWIPCDEKLPNSDKSKSYLVTKECIDDDLTISDVCTEIFWVKDNKWDCERDEFCEWKVIAWQPLPEPYKKGE